MKIAVKEVGKELQIVETDEIIKIRKKQEKVCGKCKHYTQLSKHLDKGKCEMNRKGPRRYRQAVCRKYDSKTKEFYQYKECAE